MMKQHSQSETWDPKSTSKWETPKNLLNNPEHPTTLPNHNWEIWVVRSIIWWLESHLSNEWLLIVYCQDEIRAVDAWFTTQITTQHSCCADCTIETICIPNHAYIQKETSHPSIYSCFVGLTNFLQMAMPDKYWMLIKKNYSMCILRRK